MQVLPMGVSAFVFRYQWNGATACQYIDTTRKAIDSATTMPLPLPQKGAEPHSPIFGPLLLWPNGYMHQTATGMEVGLNPGEFVLHEDPATSQKGGGAPSQIFSPWLLWSNG